MSDPLDDDDGPQGLDGHDDQDGLDGADRAAVEEERAAAGRFVAGLSGEEIRSGVWFGKLVEHGLRVYAAKADWQYFQDKYQGVPVDVVVDQRIAMAARYAALEGAVSTGAYTATVAATIGSLGGASPVTVPAAVVSFMVDVVFVTRLQLRLAHDIAVLYRVPLDVDDPDDVWKLIRVAFTIRSGELAREGVTKAVPALVRPLLKKYYSGPVLHAAKALPIVGKYLLQRNVIKFAIPAVGVPLTVAVNRYTTLASGRHAERVFRNEARVMEVARNLAEGSKHPRVLLWVGYLVASAGGVTNDEAALLRHLVRYVQEQHGVVDDELATVIDVDPGRVWQLLADEPGDVSDVVDAARRVASVDGPPSSAQRKVLADLADEVAGRDT